jgi:hypothetical protein
LLPICIIEKQTIMLLRLGPCEIVLGGT